MYEFDKRFDLWFKVKKDYNFIFDILDFILVVGWYGQGWKVKWWFFIFLVVCNEEFGMFEVVCKCIFGFIDVFYKVNKEFYDDGFVSGEFKNIKFQKFSFIEYFGYFDVWFEL